MEVFAMKIIPHRIISQKGKTKSKVHTLLFMYNNSLYIIPKSDDIIGIIYIYTHTHRGVFQSIYDLLPNVQFKVVKTWLSAPPF